MPASSKSRGAGITNINAFSHQSPASITTSSSSFGSSTDGSSTPLAAAAAAVAAAQQHPLLSLTKNPAADAAMPLLRGRRVLLVEPCKVVRTVLALALRSWGCLVCAVSSEAEAMQRLVMNGTLHLRATSAAALKAEAAAAAADGADSGTDAVAAAAGSSDALHLQHAPEMDERKFCCSGPYDCILLDMHHTR